MRLALFTVAALSLLSSVAARADELPALGSLPDGAVYGTITTGTPEDVGNIAKVLKVTENKWVAGGGVDTNCFEIWSGGPLIAVVTKGSLDVTLRDAPDNTIMKTTGGSALIFREYFSSSPKPAALIVSGTSLTLLPGDLLYSPNGIRCLISPDDQSGATFYWALGFADSAETFEDFNEGPSTPLDISLGLSTAQPPAPPFFSVGRLTIEPDTTIPLDEKTTPLLGFVESGTLTIEQTVLGGVVRRSTAKPAEPGEAATPDKPVQVNPADTFSIQPAANGALRNEGEQKATLLVVTIDQLAKIG